MTDRNRNSSTIGWIGDIEQMTIDNSDFRRVLYTGMHLQLTVMSLRAGENIGWEMHDHLDQFLRIERGTGTLKLGRSAADVTEEHSVSDDWAMIIPAGTWHDVVNGGDTELHLYSIYSPPDHPAGTIHRTKADAVAAAAADAASLDDDEEHDHHAPSPDD
jgi:mannose-6-phosphate isomerase-like protein (cupin superfamily)